MKERIEGMSMVRKGFTLIEILIVVAIIAILASIVLVGLGPTQSLGRDARRVSDLHEVQNGLELYYNKSGAYPIAAAGASTWKTLQGDLTGAAVGINAVPDDPSAPNSHYTYFSDGAGTQYILEATLENGTGGSWNGYTAPTNLAAMAGNDGPLAFPPTCTAATKQYCVTL